MKNRKLLISASAACGIALGMAAGGFAMWAAWQHNPQGAIHNADSGIDWFYWLLIGALWFAVAAAIPLLLSSGLWICSLFESRKQATKHTER